MGHRRIETLRAPPQVARNERCALGLEPLHLHLQPSERRGQFDIDGLGDAVIGPLIAAGVFGRHHELGRHVEIEAAVGVHHVADQVVAGVDAGVLRRAHDHDGVELVAAGLRGVPDAERARGPDLAEQNDAAVSLARAPGGLALALLREKVMAQRLMQGVGKGVDGIAVEHDFLPGGRSRRAHRSARSWCSARDARAIPSRYGGEGGRGLHREHRPAARSVQRARLADTLGSEAFLFAFG